LSNLKINIEALKQGDSRQLARALSLVENNLPEGNELLSQLDFEKQVPLIGITGPPGAGKSSLVNALIDFLIKSNKKVGIIAVDPTSPFNFGSLLGDRIRMANHFNNSDVFIRSVASRGSLGGLSSRIYEMTDVMKNAGFDVIFLETVGVGQSEVEIAGLADTTVVVVVPEAGDEVQTLKSGLMEIADVFVVNKSDREGADAFIKNLNNLVHQKPASDWQIPVVKTIATNGTGIESLWESLQKHQSVNSNQTRKIHLMVEKAYHLIQSYKMKDIDKTVLFKSLEHASNKTGFNLYQYLYTSYLNQ
jgi:LAO/AO transport system kinase